MDLFILFEKKTDLRLLLDTLYLTLLSNMSFRGTTGQYLALPISTRDD